MDVPSSPPPPHTPPPPPTKIPSNVSIHSNNNDEDGNSVVTVNSSSSSSFDSTISAPRRNCKDQPTAASPTSVKDTPTKLVDTTRSPSPPNLSPTRVMRAGASACTSCTSTTPTETHVPPEAGGGPPRILAPLQRLRSRARRNLGEEPKEHAKEEEGGEGGFHDRRRRRQLERMKVANSHKMKKTTWSDRLTTAWSGMVAPDVVASKIVEPRETHQGHYGTVRTFSCDDAVAGPDHEGEIPEREELNRMKVATNATKNKPTTWKESWRNIMASLAANPEISIDSATDDHEDALSETRDNYDYVFCDDLRDEEEKQQKTKKSQNDNKRRQDENDTHKARRSSNSNSNTIALSKADAKFIQDLLYTLRSVVRQLRHQVRAMEYALQDAEEENQMWKARVQELEALVMERNEAILMNCGGVDAQTTF